MSYSEYTNYSEYSNLDPTEYALQTSMPQPNFQQQTLSQPSSQPSTSSQNQMNSQQQTNSNVNTNSQKPNINNFYKQGLLKSLSNFLNAQTGTILVFMICFCIGGAFKDLVQSIISNFVQPLIIKLLLMTNIYNVSVISEIINEKDSILNLSSTLSQIISFIILLITVYFIYILINTVQQ